MISAEKKTKIVTDLQAAKEDTGSSAVQVGIFTERIKELKTEFDGCSELLDNAERIMEQQSAALKLASLALSEGVEYVEEPPEKNCTCHLSPLSLSMEQLQRTGSRDASQRQQKRGVKEDG